MRGPILLPITRSRPGDQFRTILCLVSLPPLVGPREYCSVSLSQQILLPVPRLSPRLSAFLRSATGENSMTTILRTLQLSALVVAVVTGWVLTTGCGEESQPSPAPPHAKSEASGQKSVEAPHLEEPASSGWGIVAHFGMVTTVWISEEALRDKFQVAQILHQIDRKHGTGAVWFFDSRQYAPQGVPMTDRQMLHWVGLYDPLQSETFAYVEVTDQTTSPPATRTIETTIRPGYAE